jgi:hypothetical protein
MQVFIFLYVSAGLNTDKKMSPLIISWLQMFSVHTYTFVIDNQLFRFLPVFSVNTPEHPMNTPNLKNEQKCQFYS